MFFIIKHLYHSLSVISKLIVNVVTFINLFLNIISIWIIPSFDVISLFNITLVNPTSSSILHSFLMISPNALNTAFIVKSDKSTDLPFSFISLY